MGKYVFWDKQSPIYTLGRDAETGKMVWDAQEYIDTHAPWAANPAVKVIVAGGPINGLLFMEFEATKATYIKMGLDIPDGLADEQILQLIEDFEDLNNMPEQTPTAQERIAAAMEYQNLMTMEDETV